MPIRDLGELLHPELEYPGVGSTKYPRKDDGTGGKTYKVPSPDAREGLRLTALANLGLKAAAGGQMSPEDAAAVKLDDDGEKDLYRRLLTADVYDEMLEDGVPWLTLKAIGEDALTYFGMSPELADLALELRRQGNLAARTNRATRRAAKKPSSKRATPRKRVGSKSSREPGAIPVQTPDPISTPTSTETPTTSETATA